MTNIIHKFTQEEIYLIRTCSKTLDKDSLIGQLKSYLDLEGMEDTVRGSIDKIEKITEEELKELWEFPLD